MTEPQHPDLKRPAPFDSHTGDHDDCRAYVIRLFNSQDIDVNVMETPPIFRTVYATEPWICPHGATYYLEPTSEQTAQWIKDGTP